MVIAIESGWPERVRDTALYRYLMPRETSCRLDGHELGPAVSAG